MIGIMNGIMHSLEKSGFHVTVDGYEAYVTYKIENGCLDIRHTVVPSEIGGRGIASELVKSAYDYARGCRGLRQGQSFEERRNWVTESPNLGGVTRKRKEISKKS